jgi:hypothetical protein
MVPHEPKMIETVGPFRTLRSITMLMRTKFLTETDAWRGFVAECQTRFKTRRQVRCGFHYWTAAVGIENATLWRRWR